MFGAPHAVLGVVRDVGLSDDVVARYGRCCGIVEFFGQQGIDVLSRSVVEEFVACQRERAQRGEIGRNRRNALVKTARMMLEFQETGQAAWQMTRPDPGLSEGSRKVLERFAFVEVPAERAGQVADAISGNEVRGTTLRAEVTQRT